jgi:hypothetical protein
MPRIDIQQNADRQTFRDHSLRKEFGMSKVINRHTNIAFSRENA